MKDESTAIHIKTSLWNDILERMINDGWRIIYEYDNYDKGIDADLIVLEQNGERLFFGWDNWFEGEILGTQTRLISIETMMGCTLTRGESEGPLRPGIIGPYR